MRKLAWTAYFFAAAVILVQYALPKRAVLYAGLAAALFFAAACVLSLSVRKETRLRFLCPAALGLALGFFWCLGWDAFLLRDAMDLDGQTRVMEAVVLEYPEQTAYGWSVELRLGAIRCRLYYNGGAALEPGQRVRVAAKLALTTEKTGSDYALSQGLPLFAYAEEEPALLGAAPHVWRFFPVKLGRLLREGLLRVFDARSAPFLTALLTGDRSLLREDVFGYAMLKEAGLAHCVAVSGMHLSFLVSFLYVLLGRGRLASLVCIPAVFLFMAMTGFTASVLRAGVMQLSVCCAALTKREYDAKTALPLALMLLLALNPYSVKGAGLQLSFAATLGILLFAPPLRAWLLEKLALLTARRWAALPVRAAASTLSVSLAASVLTTPVLALVFGKVSLLAPLSNLLALWAVSLAFIFGLLAAILGFVWMPAALVLGVPAGLLARYIMWVAETLGALPFASVYTDSLYAGLWLALLYSAMALFRYGPGLSRRMRAFALSAVCSLILLRALELAERNADALRVAALDVGQGQCVVLTAAGVTAVVDCGGSLSDNAGDLAAEYLLAMGRRRVDALVLTHFHSDHANGAQELMRRLRVEKLYIPGLDDGQDTDWTVIDAALAEGTEPVFIREDVQTLALEDLELTLVPPLGGAGDNEAGLCVLSTLGEFTLLITGDADSETELRLTERLSLPDIDLLVAGHHGSKTSCSPRLLEAVSPETVLFSVGRNAYGLPAGETLARVAETGAGIYRTDTGGTIVASYRGEGAGGLQ